MREKALVLWAAPHCKTGSAKGLGTTGLHFWGCFFVFATVAVGCVACRLAQPHLLCAGETPALWAASSGQW